MLPEGVLLRALASKISLISTQINSRPDRWSLADSTPTESWQVEATQTLSTCRRHIRARFTKPFDIITYPQLAITQGSPCLPLKPLYISAKRSAGFPGEGSFAAIWLKATPYATQSFNCHVNLLSLDQPPPSPAWQCSAFQPCFSQKLRFF